jgi:uncharacterized protein YbjT (DUF2867 family)
MDPKTALVLGGSGLVGRFCLQALLQDANYRKVILLTRRELPIEDPAKLTQKVIDFDKIESTLLEPVDDVFCALGTTIRTAGSQAAFRRVDFEFPLAAARLALKFGAQQFIVVSSVGTNPKSRNFYLRTKGELEQALCSLPFKAVHIFRPSFLTGAREETRPGESFAIPLAKVLQFVMAGPLRRYRPIAAVSVGRAMVSAAKSPGHGRIVHEYNNILRLAEGLKSIETR